MLPQLCPFWDMFWTKLAYKFFYKASISGMRLRLAELQESDKEAQKIRVKGLNKYKKLNAVLYHQKLPFVTEIIQIELIS